MRVLEPLRCRPVAVLCLAAVCFAGWLHAEARNPTELPPRESDSAACEPPPVHATAGEPTRPRTLRPGALPPPELAPSPNFATVAVD